VATQQAAAEGAGREPAGGAVVPWRGNMQQAMWWTEEKAFPFPFLSFHGCWGSAGSRQVLRPPAGLVVAAIFYFHVKIRPAGRGRVASRPLHVLSP